MDTSRPIIGYQPLFDEVNYLEYFSSLNPETIMFLPTAEEADPFHWADICQKKYSTEIPNVLIPGTKFDLRGTRYGRGGGWYDRFLSQIPNTWLRIGIADISKISPIALERRPWDQPLDWLVVKNGGDWMVYETGARTLYKP